MHGLYCFSNLMICSQFYNVLEGCRVWIWECCGNLNCSGWYEPNCITVLWVTAHQSYYHWKNKVSETGRKTKSHPLTWNLFSSLVFLIF